MTTNQKPNAPQVTNPGEKNKNPGGQPPASDNKPEAEKKEAAK